MHWLALTVALGVLKPSVCAGKGQGGLLGLKCWGTCGEWDLRRVFQGRKHFKHLGFQEIMLKLESQGYPLPPEPIAQARLPELRAGKALTICLSATRIPLRPLWLVWARPRGGHHVPPGVLSCIHCPIALAWGQSPRQHQQVPWSLSFRS